MTKKEIDWYSLAREQTFETLSEFITDVRKAFPGYEKLNEQLKEKEIKKYSKEYFDLLESLNANGLYQNGIIAGIIISYAAFHATSTQYGYSCNQAGVVRNCFYKAIMDEPVPLEKI